MTGSAAKTRRKRTAPLERRAAILEAAAATFFEKGFSASSIDMIIERVGGSKRTLYKDFGNKEALFVALVRELAEQALAPLGASGSGDQALEKTLHLFARSLLTAYASPSLIGVYRAIINEAFRFPELAREFYDKGPGLAAARLKEILDAADERGEIGPVDTAVAAEQFVSMMRDNLHLQVVLGLRPPPDAAEIDRRAANAALLFLHGIQPSVPAPVPPRTQRKKSSSP